MKIVQIMPAIVSGDAVSNDARAIYKVISEMGFRTGIYAENDKNITPHLKDLDYISSLDKMPPLEDDDIIIYHHSTGTEKLCDMLPEMKGHKMMIYHNVTPSHYFTKYNGISEILCNMGRKSVYDLAPFIEYVMADSTFNANELIEAGYKCPINVRPILIPFSDYEKDPEPGLLKTYSDDYTNILFVGRVAPNKCQHDIITAFAYYKRHLNPKSRLIIAGSDGGMESYSGALQYYVKMLSLDDVVFTGHIRFSEILSYYRLADIFLCMSEHEGFCVPLVEAMFFDVPIIAYDSSAISETLGGAGILTKSKDPVFTARLMDRLVSDKQLREQVVESEKKRLEYFSYENVRSIFVSQLQDFISKISREKGGQS